jgi:hypothetical protein
LYLRAIITNFPLTPSTLKLTSNMGAILMAVILTGAVAVGTAGQIWKNLSPGKKKIRQDLMKLRKEVQEVLANDLVPIDQKELGMLSYNRSSLVKKKRHSAGVTTSIYHEPMIAWKVLFYPSRQGKSGLLYAKTARHEFIYRITKKGIEIAIGNDFLGVLSEEGVLHAPNGKKVIGRYGTEPTDGYLPFYLHQKEIANILVTNASATPNPRVFGLLEPLTEEQSTILLSVAIPRLIEPALI